MDESDEQFIGFTVHRIHIVWLRVDTPNYSARAHLQATDSSTSSPTGYRISGRGLKCPPSESLFSKPLERVNCKTDPSNDRYAQYGPTIVKSAFYAHPLDKSGRDGSPQVSLGQFGPVTSQYRAIRNGTSARRAMCSSLQQQMDDSLTPGLHIRDNIMCLYFSTQKNCHA